MKKEKLDDLKPMHLKKLSFDVEKLIVKKEKEQKKIFKKIRKVFKL
jgi:hypothetical protein